MKKIFTWQFSEITGISTKNLHTYQQRGKLHFIKEGKTNVIDLLDPVNEKFLLEQTSKKGKVIQVKDIIPETKRRITQPYLKTKSTTARKSKSNSSAKVMAPVSELEIHRTEKMKHDAELSRIRFEREAGRILPKDLAEQVFNAHFANASREFYNGADNYTIIINDRLGGTKKDLAFFRTKLISIIDDSIKTALENSLKEIEKICIEYSKRDSKT